MHSTALDLVVACGAGTGPKCTRRTTTRYRSSLPERESTVHFHGCCILANDNGSRGDATTERGCASAIASILESQ